MLLCLYTDVFVYSYLEPFDDPSFDYQPTSTPEKQPKGQSPLIWPQSWFQAKVSR